MIDVCYLNPDHIREPTLIDRLHTWLDQTEQDRLVRFLRGEDQHRFLVSHALVRAMLGKQLNCHPKQVQIGTTKRGKPIVLASAYPSTVHFNLSHTTGLIVMATSQAPIGVDAERLSRRIPGTELAARYFTAAEIADIRQNHTPEGNQRFLSYWTLKEAYLKAEGWGIVDGLDGFGFELSPKNQWPAARIRLRVHDGLSCPTRPWQFHQWAIESDHIVSAAVCAREAASATIQLRAWTEQDW